jgi:hypothetical protein
MIAPRETSGRGRGAIDKPNVPSTDLSINTNPLEEALSSLRRTLEAQWRESEPDSSEDPGPEYWWQK